MTAAARTLVRGAWVLPMGGPEEAIADGAVAIGDDGGIAAVGSWEELRAAHPEAEAVGDGNGIVLPGLVNGHTHFSESLISGMGECTLLFEWFERVIGPPGAVITREEMRIGTRLKAVEMLRSGATTVNDMTCHRNPGAGVSLGAVEGLAEVGMRGVISFGAEDLYEGAPPPDVFMAEHEALAERIAPEPLVDFRVGIGTVLGLSDELFARTVAACAEHGWAVHTHLAEVREEVTESRLRHGATTIAHSDRVGLLEHEVLAAHCVWCTPEDVGLLVSRDVRVCHNPIANSILGDGVCPAPELRRAGLVVGLGTDGAASNDNQDMLAVLKATGLMHKVRTLDPTAIDAREVLQMATIDGARALGMERLIGSLEPGKRADLFLLDGNTPELATIHDPFQQVVYCATTRCVSDVWVDGRARLAGGELVGLDERQLAREARRAATDLVRRCDLEESALTRPRSSGVAS